MTDRRAFFRKVAALPAVPAALAAVPAMDELEVWAQPLFHLMNAKTKQRSMIDGTPVYEIGGTLYVRKKS